MDIEWNADAGEIMNTMVRRTPDALTSVVYEYSGHSVDEVKLVLEQRWNASNDGARITDPELSTVSK